MPIHTVYVGAHAFNADTPSQLAKDAHDFWEATFPEEGHLEEGLDLPSELAAEVHRRVSRRLLQGAPGEIGAVIEDLRLDFEDGYAGQGDADEDRDAKSCAQAAATLERAGQLPPGFGLRIRSMQPSTAARARRTLELFVSQLLDDSGALPSGFVVTLAKIDHPTEVTHLVETLEHLERRLGLPAGTFPVELMAETPRSIYDAEGRLAVPVLVAAAKGRCVGVHFGIYDYTASLGVVAGLQGLRHPACDFARAALQVGLAGTGVELSDGSSRRVPSLERDSAPDELQRSIRGVYDDVRHSLARGIYRGWDMAPSHLVLRWLAVTAFFLEHLPEMARRFCDTVPPDTVPPDTVPPEEHAAETGVDGDLEDAATTLALRTFFRLGLACGALEPDDLPAGAAASARSRSA